jgi:hypothetical protein
MRGLSDEAALSLITPYSAIFQTDDPIMRRLIFLGTESNPRRIKRFINTYFVLVQMSERAGTSVSASFQQLAVVLLIQMRFPDHYDELVRDAGMITAFHQALTLNVDQRDETFRRHENLRRIYDDPMARRFFEATRDIDCSKTALERWVLLARGLDASNTTTVAWAPAAT